MIESFADRRARVLFGTGTAKRFPADIRARVIRKLEYVHLASELDDLRVPPGNRLLRIFRRVTDAPVECVKIAMPDA